MILEKEREMSENGRRRKLILKTPIVNHCKNSYCNKALVHFGNKQGIVKSLQIALFLFILASFPSSSKREAWRE